MTALVLITFASHAAIVVTFWRTTRHLRGECPPLRAWRDRRIARQLGVTVKQVSDARLDRQRPVTVANQTTNEPGERTA